MKKKKRIFPYLIALVVVLIILLLVGKKQGWIGKDFGINVATSLVERKTIVEYITANGKVQPEVQVKISPEVPGEIIDLFVEEGDEVKNGDLLAVIKPDLYIQALNRAKAGVNSSLAMLSQAEARLIESEMSYNRSKSLYEQEAIPVSEYESAEAAFKISQSEVKAAEFSVKSSEATVAEAEEQLVKTKIYSPMDGIVSKLRVEKGERVVGTNMYQGTEMMIIADLDKMEVKVDVNENDIIKVQKLDTALVEVDAYYGRKFKGVVTKIANSADVTGNSADQVTNFEVKVLLVKKSYEDLITTENNYPFRPGMSATVDIQTNIHENVLSVPIQAVTTRIPNLEVENDSLNESAPEQEKLEVVFLYEEGKALQQTVETGIQDNAYIEILEGVSDSMEVITAPYHAINKLLKDSMMVKKVDEKQLFSASK